MPALSAPPRLLEPVSATGPDLAAAAVPLLRRLRNTLVAATPRPDRWGVPPLFFFRPELQHEWEAAKPATRHPLDADTADLVDDAVSMLAASADVRKAARATPGLTEATVALAGHAPRVRELAGLLTLLDDEIVRVVHPSAGIGWRARVRGVADVGQLHTLLIEAVARSSARGILAGVKSDPRAVAIYRGEENGSATATTRFRLLAPTALAAGLSAGPEGAAHWLFPTQPLRSVPRTLAGERAMVLAEAGRVSWLAERAVPRVGGELELIATMTAADVRDWVVALGGTTTAAPARAA